MPAWCVIAMRASKDGSKPLAGLHHAVIGYGESVYDTFQVILQLSLLYCTLDLP